MAGVAEHDGEQERKGGDGVEARIDFAVRGQTVGVDHGLEGLGELVGPEVRRRRRLSIVHIRNDRLERRTCS